jgi:hypothetical protein
MPLRAHYERTLPPGNENATHRLTGDRALRIVSGDAHPFFEYDLDEADARGLILTGR